MFMNKLSETVQAHLLAAIDNDDLVLPTLPEVALSIREAAENSEISVAALSRVIGRDAALSARLIKVVNSPLLRALVEVTNLHTAITRLGVNYSCNLAIGLVIEQIFHARSPSLESTLRDIWQNSLEVAGVSYEIARRHTHLKPDQAALGGLVHQIGALPVLAYAQEHDELLADPVWLQPVIARIHPILGDKLLQTWDFPAQLCTLPSQVQQLARETDNIDYVGVVQIARALCLNDADCPASSLPAYQHLRLPAGRQLDLSELLAARDMLR